MTKSLYRNALPYSILNGLSLYYCKSIFSGEVAAGIAALVLKNNLEEIIEDKMKHGMVSYGRNGFKGTVSRDGFGFLMI